MSTKPGIFEQVKQPGKVVPTFTANLKLSQLNFQSQERPIGPSMPCKTEGKSLIFSNTTREALKDNADVMSSYRSNTDESENRGQFNNLFQESMQQQFKALFSQWKTEIFEEVRNSLNECNVKFNRNKETIELIKQHLRVNTQSINEIESRLSDYEQKIVEVESLKMNESNPFEQENTQTASTLKNMMIIEQRNSEHQNDSATLAKYVKLTDELLQNFEQYKTKQAEERAEMIEQLQNNLTEALESKTEKIIEDVGRKIEDIENQVNDSKKYEDAKATKKFDEIERKFASFDESLKEEISALQSAIENIASEAKNKQGVRPETPRFEDYKQLIDSVMAQIPDTGSQLNEMQETFEIKLEQLEDKWQKQFKNLDVEAQRCSAEIGALAGRLEGANTGRDMHLLGLIDSLNKEIDVLTTSQNANSVEIARIGKYVEELKQMASTSFSELEKKLSVNETANTKIKELELEVKSLMKNIEDAKQSTPKASVSTGSEVKYDANKYKSYIGSGKSLDKQHQTSEKVETKSEETSNKSSYKPSSSYLSSTSSYKSPANRYSAGDYQSNGFKASANTSEGSKVLSNRSQNYYVGENGAKNSAPQNTKSANSDGKENMPLSTTLTVQNVSPKNLNSVSMHSGNPLQEKLQEKNMTSPGHLPVPTGEKQTQQNQLAANRSPYSLKLTQDDVSKLRRSGELPKLLSPTVGELQLQSPKMNLHLSKFSTQQEDLVCQPDEEDQEMIYQFDENGFLLDEDGNYILDENDQMIKLDMEQIERLRASNLLEEELN